MAARKLAAGKMNSKMGVPGGPPSIDHHLLDFPTHPNAENLGMDINALAAIGQAVVARLTSSEIPQIMSGPPGLLPQNRPPPGAGYAGNPHAAMMQHMNSASNHYQGNAGYAHNQRMIMRQHPPRGYPQRPMMMDHLIQKGLHPYSASEAMPMGQQQLPFGNSTGYYDINSKSQNRPRNGNFIRDARNQRRR